MKRFFASLLCALILTMLPVNANAEQSSNFESARALYAYWTNENSLPDFITGIWSSDGSAVNLTFGVTNDVAGREGAKLILDLVTNDNTVTIAYQTYPLNVLSSIQADIEQYLEDDIGFKGVGVNVWANRVDVDVDQKRIEDPATTTVVNDLTEKYGNAVFFNFTNLICVPTTGSAHGPASGFLGPIHNQNNAQSPLLFGMIAICVVSFVALLLSEYKRRKLLVLLTRTGTATIAHSKPS